ncbi:MAG: InlB B-repeat-containing protein [Spirochaetaceae bacterium]|jgi:uncharacterized repeat protein (TIGR02543 family)|nr:InlB B-repeat-containing protein [Spirochaetaceae bacterium]
MNGIGKKRVFWAAVGAAMLLSAAATLLGCGNPSGPDIETEAGEETGSGSKPGTGGSGSGGGGSGGSGGSGSGGSGSKGSSGSTAGGTGGGSYTVTFDPDGGSGGTQTRQVASGGTIGTAMPEKPSKSGLIFSGWYTQQYGGDKEFTGNTPVNGTITVYAYWVKPVYIVTLDADGGEPARQTRSGNDTGIEGWDSLEYPQKEGYFFSNWQTERDGNGTAFYGAMPIHSDTTLYAKWDKNVYWITFILEYGYMANQNVTHGGTATMPTDPTRLGCTFSGWYTEKNGVETEFTATTPVTAMITVYPKWTINTYTVTLDGGGAVFAPQSVTVEHGGHVGDQLPLYLTKAGHIFDGWYTGPKGSDDWFSPYTMVTSNMTVYANWIAEDPTVYYVRFVTFRGTPEEQSFTVAPGQTLSEPQRPTWAHGTFLGWYTQEDDGNLFEAAAVVNANRTYYAHWSLKQYTVTFDADGGEPSVRTHTMPYGLLYYSPSDPIRPGYAFGGWFSERNGGGSLPGNVPIEKNTTLYAKWEPLRCEIIFDATGGNPAQTAGGAYYGKTVGASNMPSNPTKTGYTFGGWFSAPDGGGSAFTGGTTVTTDTVPNILSKGRVYAKWTPIPYTVTFNADGGSPATQTRTVNYGTSAGTLPTPARTGYAFDGWYTAQNGGGTEFTGATPVTANITVYAKWAAAQVPSDLSLADALTWITANAVAGGEYTITVKQDKTIPPTTLSYGGKPVHITLAGDTTERTVSLGARGSLFRVESGVTLTLDDKLTLRGRSENIYPLVWVNSDGTLEMQTGSKITGNSGDGGVYVYGGTFTMSGGEISDNFAGFYSGGGVAVGSSGTFTMSGGEISGNVSAGSGGGVAVYSSGTFTMSGGEISGNSSVTGGGGVDVSNGTFTMSGGEISGNYSSSVGGGGGVYVSNGTFTMNGGEISGNSASDSGGGVYVSYGTFTKQGGGTIYGSDASAALKNTARGDGYGHAVYVESGNPKKRDTTAGPGVNMNSGISGSAGGWE